MSYQGIIEQNKEWIDKTFENLDKKLSRTSVKSRDKIPYTTKNGEHDSRTVGPDIAWWTNGFWGGLMWLMYEATKKDCYRLTAENAEKIMDGAFNYIDEIHHDVGFTWHIMSGASYALTGNRKSRDRDLFTAMMLMSRYNIDGEYIVAWPGKDKRGWSIIDCLMNIPQLYWASREIGDDRFKKVAMKHADMAMRDHVREDGSVVHIVEHYLDKVGVVKTHGGQGYGEGSCWSRGASWAVYGFILSYIHTGEQRYLQTAKKTAKYFIENIKNTGWLPVIDFKAPPTPVGYDSTAGAVAACGLIEIAKRVGEDEKDYYLSAAVNMLKAMESAWCDWSETEDSILQNGTERYWSERKDGTLGDPMPIIYGDFFFAEAILKLKGSDFLIW